MRRALILSTLLAVAVAACGDDSTASTATRGPVDVAITVSAGVVTVSVGGAPATDHVSVARDAEVHLTVTSDVADEVHLHGYDLSVDLEEGVAGSIDFTADVAGIFEIELEASTLHLIDLEVA